MPASPPLRIVTFNAGLAVGVLPYASERAPHVARAIAALEADVVFVQEVWLEPQWAALRAATTTRFPHAYRAAPTQPAVHGACSAAELQGLIACANEHCAGLESDALARCVLRSCGHVAMTLSTPCLNCIVSHPVGTLDEIVGPCLAAEGSSTAAAAGAASRASGSRYAPAGLVAYGGSFGTGILSAVPLHDCDVLVYDASSMNARSALHARLQWPALGDVHVFGTHLSPGIHEEQTRQLDLLLPWIETRAGAAATTADRATGDRTPVVLLGDFNTGPSVNGGSGGARPAHLPALYQRLVRAGFANPYLESGRAACTYCHGSLSSGNHGTSGWLIDHVLVRDVPGRATGDRVLDEPLVIDAAGRRITTTYSDHCGVRLTIELPPG